MGRTVTLSILGGGSWGTALAIVLAPRFERVRLWVFEQDLAARMAVARENDVFLPGFAIPDNVEIVSDLHAVTDGGGILLAVAPSNYSRALYQRVLPMADPATIFVIATKGLEIGTLLPVSQVLREVLCPRFEPQVAVLSGPSFRLYTNNDLTGVEIGGALKNVIAIAAGVVQGLGMGNNTQAALITRGLAEITRLAVAMGAQRATLAGLAGLGDLVLTCGGDLSRNRRVGVELARGRSLSDITASTPMIAEGVETCAAAVTLGAKYGVDLPIICQMDAVLHRGKAPREAIRDLMERSLKGE